jgi:predicted acylesterase/phospholipase RssA
MRNGRREQHYNPLRDYDLLDEFNDDNASIVEAALATSAATTFFEPVRIGARTYVDGALGANTPVDYVWNEAQSIWCPDDGQLEPMVKCFVSVGTGNPGLTPVEEGAKDFLSKT